MPAWLIPRIERRTQGGWHGIGIWIATTILMLLRIPPRKVSLGRCRLCCLHSFGFRFSRALTGGFRGLLFFRAFFRGRLVRDRNRSKVRRSWLRGLRILWSRGCALLHL